MGSVAQKQLVQAMFKTRANPLDDQAPSSNRFLSLESPDNTEQLIYHNISLCFSACLESTTD